MERLKKQDPTGWTEFASRYGQLMRRLAERAGCTPDEIQEVVQETLFSVAKEIPRFDADPRRGAFGVWLLTITRRRIVDQLRKRPPQGRFVDLGGCGTGTPSVNQIPGAIFGFEEQWEEDSRQSLFHQALEKLKTQVNPAHFKIFYLAVIKEKSVSEVANALKVSATQVYLVNHRLSALLKRELRTLDDL